MMFLYQAKAQNFLAHVLPNKIQTLFSVLFTLFTIHSSISIFQYSKCNNNMSTLMLGRNIHLFSLLAPILCKGYADPFISSHLDILYLSLRLCIFFHSKFIKNCAHHLLHTVIASDLKNNSFLSGNFTFSCYLFDR